MVGERVGKEYLTRARGNKRNLQDLLRYFRYGQTSGDRAARVNEEQELYWADLLEKLLGEKK